MKPTQEEIKRVLSSQTNEMLDQIPYEGVNVTKKLPLAPMKGMFLTLSGKVKGTYTGTPVIKKNGLLDALISEIEVVDARGNLVSARPRDFRFHSKRITGKDSPALLEKNSEVLTSAAEVKFFELAPSGQWARVEETIYIPFENELAEADFLDTILNYDGKHINTLKLNVEKLDKLLAESNTEAVTWEKELTFEVNCLTTADQGTGARWVRGVEERTFSSAPTRAKFELNSVDKLMGLKIEVTKGVDRTPITFEEAKKVKIEFFSKKGNTGVYLKDENLASLMMNDLNKKKMASMQAGVGYMNFISGNLAETALPNTYDVFEAQISMDSSLGINGTTNEYHVRVLHDELE